MRPPWATWLTAAVVLLISADASAQRRMMRAEDLFRVDRVGAISWSPDRKRASIEIHRPGRWLDPSIPTGHIHLLDLTSVTLRTISPSSPAFVGFFGARWSPDGRRLAFLSVDTNAVVRPWISSVGGRAPAMLRGLELSDALADPPVIMWSDSDHVVLMVRESPQRTAGPLYSQIVRGRTWRKTGDGHETRASLR